LEAHDESASTFKDVVTHSWEIPPQLHMPLLAMKS
jgi:hypothetical protein